ncbi:YSC84-related protein [Desulfococcus sp.]|uniref:lipid-binding SYLF domain-containing protein n=1 Tax=Desulfococcus sp. TaxID=2025834 RepID=UPI0035939DA9
MRHLRLTTVFLGLAFAAFTLLCSNPAHAASAAEINRDANRVLQKLYKISGSAKALGEKAKAILVFPAITKGGFMVGGQYGEGALMKAGKTIAYYNTVSVSYGLQAGVQTYGYALFFMTDSARAYLDRSDGWEVGTGPSIVIVDEGAARSLSTTTAKSDVYAFTFNQKGLMGGLGLQGTKITKIEK